MGQRANKFKEKKKRQTDPYGKAMKKLTKNICFNKMRNISIWKQTFFRG